MKEERVQAQCTELYQLHGGFVYDLSQGYRPGIGKHATTRQTSGLGDLWVFFTKFAGYHVVQDGSLVLWHEVKALPLRVLRTALPKDHGPWRALIDNDQLAAAMNDSNLYHSALAAIDADRRLELYARQRSTSQGLFANRCLQCQIPYVLGGLEEASAWIESNLNGGDS